MLPQPRGRGATEAISDVPRLGAAMLPDKKIPFD
jgi:hypothetical protein